MNSRYRAFRESLLSAVFLAGSVLLSGCLNTTHHFNSGRLLEPDVTSTTFGAGMQPGKGIINSIGYRLGLRGPWGPFTGVELGWSVEAPTNPVTLEFDLKLGLPKIPRLETLHSLSAGWGIGSWADNSWLLEYAAGHSWNSHSVYGSYRLTYLATQPQDLGDFSTNGKFASDRQLYHQATLGWLINAPAVPVIPDWVSPQVTVTYPGSPGASKDRAAQGFRYSTGFNLGLGWDFR